MKKNKEHNFDVGCELVNELFGMMPSDINASKQARGILVIRLTDETSLSSRAWLEDILTRISTAFVQIIIQTTDRILLAAFSGRSSNA